MPAAGTTTLYRPVPPGFDDLFIRVGWTDIEDETRAHARTIRKWLDLRNFERRSEGLLTLQEARSAYLAQFGIASAPRSVARVGARRSASRYVSGRTNRKFVGWPSSAPKFWEVGLLADRKAPPPEKPAMRRMTAATAAKIVERAAKSMVASPDYLAGMAKAVELLRGMEA